MLEKIALTESFTPVSEVFALHEYSKVVYPLNSHLCLRDVFDYSAKPNYMRLDHQFFRIRALYSFADSLLSVQQTHESRKDLWLRSHGPNPYSLRIPSELYETKKNEFFLTACLSSNIILIVCSTLDDNELIAVDLKARNILAKGFYCGKLTSISMSSSILASLHNKDGTIDIFGFKTSPLGTNYQEIIYHRTKFGTAASKFACHCWIGEELIAASTDKSVLITTDFAAAQKIVSPSALCNVKQIECGFIGCCENTIFIFKRISAVLSVVAQLELKGVGSGINFQLSPQEDFLAYFDTKRREVVAVTNFHAKCTASKSLSPMRIGHNPSNSFRIYGSAQSLFVTTQANELTVFSAVSMSSYLQVQLNQEETVIEAQNNEYHPKLIRAPEPSTDNSKLIVKACIHPFLPLVAVVLTGRVLIYWILYSELRLLKSLPVTNCRQLGFSRSGGILHLVVEGKQGAKIYLYNFVDFELVESVSVGRRGLLYDWAKLDSLFIVAHEKGFIAWDASSRFKNRTEVDFKLKWSPQGMVLTSLSDFLLWNGSKLALWKEDNSSAQIELEAKIDRVSLLPSQGFLILLQTGKFMKLSTIDQLSLKTAGFLEIQPFGASQQFQLVGANYVFVQTSLNQLLIFQHSKLLSKPLEIVCVKRNALQSLSQEYKIYESTLQQIGEKFSAQFTAFREEAKKKLQEKEEQFATRMREISERQKAMKDENERLQQLSRTSSEKTEKDTMRRVDELEKLYQRKIALITNKLLTSDEINFRNMSQAQSNLAVLEQKHQQDVEIVRKRYASQMDGLASEKNYTKAEIMSIRMEYESRLVEAEQQNDLVVVNLQQRGDQTISSYLQKINRLEDSLSKEKSQKMNFQAMHQDLERKNYELQQRLQLEKSKREEQIRRGQLLSDECQNLKVNFAESTQRTVLLQRKNEELSKFNQILKHRVSQFKDKHDPQETEVIKLKSSLIELESQYSKLLAQKDEALEQALLFKQEAEKKRNEVTSLQTSKGLTQKKYFELIDRLRDIAKLPIQQIRKQLVLLVDRFHQVEYKHKDQKNSPLGEINRIKDHLEVCLTTAVSSNKKQEEQRQQELIKKNIQNAQLLLEINELRKKVRGYEQASIHERKHGMRQTINSEDCRLDDESQIDRSSTRDGATSQTLTKTRARMTQQDMGLFQTGWRERRLRTEHGRRQSGKKGLKRDNSLIIEPVNNDVEDYRRVIEQKDIIIKQLINRLQNLS